ncbi:MAG: Rieske 2Fe-2S domain-containing protein, partial [Alphaproteobacteria bacterium]
MTSFVRNEWYVAAWDHEVTRQPLARVYMNEPVVLFRTEAGKAVALEDRCC